MVAHDEMDAERAFRGRQDPVLRTMYSVSLLACNGGHHHHHHCHQTLALLLPSPCCSLVLSLSHTLSLTLSLFYTHLGNKTCTYNAAPLLKGCYVCTYLLCVCAPLMSGSGVIDYYPHKLVCKAEDKGPSSMYTMHIHMYGRTDGFLLERTEVRERLYTLIKLL